MPPNASASSSIADPVVFSSLTSADRYNTFVVARVYNSSDCSCDNSGSRAIKPNWAPSFASCLASANPSPDEPPVSKTLPNPLFDDWGVFIKKPLLVLVVHFVLHEYRTQHVRWLNHPVAGMQRADVKYHGHYCKKSAF